MKADGGAPKKSPKANDDCSCKSLAVRSWERFKVSRESIDSLIESVSEWPLDSATSWLAAAGGGFAAKSYKGITVLQEAARYTQIQRTTSFSLFRRGRPDFVRAGSTSAVTTAAVVVAWNAGLLIGSGLYEFATGKTCE